MLNTSPHLIPIAIDRKKLVRYWRSYAILGYCLLLAVVGIVIGIAVAEAEIELDPDANIVYLTVKNVMSRMLIGSIVGFVVYLVVHHFTIPRFVRTLESRVEGSYLRVIRRFPTLVDRKIHFRMLSDYACVSGPLMKRFGIVHIRIEVRGAMPNHIMLYAVPDAFTVRDQLAELDSMRSHDTPLPDQGAGT